MRVAKTLCYCLHLTLRNLHARYELSLVLGSRNELGRVCSALNTGLCPRPSFTREKSGSIFCGVVALRRAGFESLALKRAGWW